ncbi:MAG TPA: hypothetical protein PK095_26025, partial [Myxococcota bacterium]|nr:hypothetical protein [Myxococcota bacterium]
MASPGLARIIIVWSWRAKALAAIGVGPHGAPAMTTALDVSIEHQKDLGWPRILQALADRASTEPGRDACLDLDFHEDYESAFETLYAVDELVT